MSEESNARVREKQAERRAAGMCYICGKNPSGDKGGKCATCRESAQRANAKRRRKRKDNRLCVHCEKKLSEDNKGSSCVSCREHYNRYDAKQHKQRKDEGLCTKCVKNPSEGKGTTCVSCRDRESRATANRHKQRKDNGLCVRCKRVAEPGRTLCERCSTKGRQYKAKVRDEVLEEYGGPTCVCCGETQKEFLEIDHVNGDGAAHRREIGRGNFYSWLKKNNFPPSFQVLCRNCNGAKGQDGCCPHHDEVNDEPAIRNLRRIGRLPFTFDRTTLYRS